MLELGNNGRCSKGFRIMLLWTTKAEKLLSKIGRALACYHQRPFPTPLSEEDTQSPAQPSLWIPVNSSRWRAWKRSPV